MKKGLVPLLIVAGWGVGIGLAVLGQETPTPKMTPARRETILQRLRERADPWHNFTVEEWEAIHEWDAVHEPIENGNVTDSGRGDLPTLRAFVLGVTDGDTLHCRIEGPDGEPLGQPWSPIGVRIKGIDTPERKDKRPEIAAIAEAARNKTRALCLRRTVTLRQVGRDKYFRLIAVVQVARDPSSQRGTSEDGGGPPERSEDLIDVGQELLRANLAKPYQGRGAKPW